MSTAPKLASVSIRLERVACPRCSSSKSTTVYAAQDHIYRLPGTFYAASCNHCGLWFQNPRPFQEVIPLLYPSSYGPHAETTPRAAVLPRPVNAVRTIWHGWNQGFLTIKLGYEHRSIPGRTPRLAALIGSSLSSGARWRAGCDLIPRFVPEGRLLEIGCGNGDTLKKLRDLGWRNLHGIELSDAAARIARRAGFTVKTATIETALHDYPDNSFDVIVAEMVLEHLLNPFTVVQQIARKLKPGGEFLFSTVIRDSLDGRIFGSYSVCYDFPRHMVFFRKRDLDDMLHSDFDQIHSWHQSTPIDFQRPAHLRDARFDPQLRKFFKSRAGAHVVQLLARLKLMSRVSYRCRRK